MSNVSCRIWLSAIVLVTCVARAVNIFTGGEATNVDGIILILLSLISADHIFFGLPVGDDDRKEGSEHDGA